MNLEPNIHDQPVQTGWIEAITGCMFSGKTEELIRRLRRAKYARQSVVIIKPQIDTRYSTSEIVSHNEQSLPSIQLHSPHQIEELAKNASVIGIDEVQFFGEDVVEVINKLANNGKRVIVAGLDQDYTGKPFEPMPQILAIAEYITKTLAICVECGNPADRTQRKIASGERVLIGAADMYEARCRKCHYTPKEIK